MWVDKYKTTTGNALVHLAVDQTQATNNSNKPSTIVHANQGWINVRRSGLNGSNHVRAVITTKANYEPNSNCNFECGRYNQQTQVVDLQFAEPGRFTAPINPFIMGAQDYTGKLHVTEQVGLVIDGVWQKGSDGKDVEFKLGE